VPSRPSGKGGFSESTAFGSGEGEMKSGARRVVDSVRTAKKTQLFTITMINWLTLFKEIIAIYPEEHMKPINTLY
jgi:hypothetical protein